MTKADATNEANVSSETLEQRERDLGEIFDAQFHILNNPFTERYKANSAFWQELQSLRAKFIRDRAESESDDRDFNEEIVIQLELHCNSIIIISQEEVSKNLKSDRTQPDETVRKRLRFLRTYSRAAEKLGFEYVHELSRLVAEYWSSISPASATLFSKNTTVLFLRNVLALVTDEVREMTTSEVDRFKDIPISWRLTMLGLVPPSDERFKAYPLSELIDDDNEKLDFLTYYNNPLDLTRPLQDSDSDR